MKFIPNFENLYSATEDGQIFSHITNKFLKQSIQKAANTNYRYVTLVKGQERKNYLVHRLVASTFLENPENKPCVNHIDNNGENNNTSNIEWCTYSENLIHAQNQGRLYHAQLKCGIVQTNKLKKLAYEDALSMVGNTYGSFKVLRLKGLKKVGKSQLDRYYFECEHVRTGALSSKCRHQLKALTRDTYSKSERAYFKAKQNYVNTSKDCWNIVGIDDHNGKVSACRLHLVCKHCSTSETVPVSAVTKRPKLKKCPNCKATD